MATKTNCFAILKYGTITIFILVYFFRAEGICQAEKWKSIGPPGIDYNTTIKHDPSYGKYYVFANNKLYRNDDNGDSWFDISPEYLGDSYKVDLIIKDNNPAELYYLNIAKGAIYKSTDTGDTWNLFYSDSNRSVIFLDKSNPQIMIASKAYGGWGNFFAVIQKSTDAGTNWHTVMGIDSSIGPITPWVNPNSSNIIYADQTITYGGDVIDGRLFYKSTNGGIDWNKVNLDNNFSFEKFLFDPNDENVIYVKKYYGSWLKSTDGGNSWIEFGLELHGEDSRNLLISPYDPNILYMASSSKLPEEYSVIYKSEDGGVHWAEYSYVSPSQYISSMVIDPTNHDELFITTYPYGVIKIIESGQNWIIKSNGINQSQICSFSSTTSDIAYAGVANRGFFRTTDAGQNWYMFVKNVSSCPGLIVVSKTNPNLIFSNAYINGLRFSVSQDGGDTWESYPCNYNGLNIFDVADDDRTIYGDAFLGDIDGLIISGIIKSSNGGISWQLLNLGIDNVNYIDKIEVDPFNKEIVFAIVAIRGTVNKNSLIRTTNGGESWAIVSDTAGNFFINKGDSKYVYHCYGKNIYISENKGESFSNILIGYELKDIVTNKIKSWELYGITYNGLILMSEDHGYSWSTVYGLQKDMGIQDLQIYYPDSGYAILFGSTWYNGILKYELNNQIISIKPEQSRDLNYQLTQNYPNPFNPSTTISFSIPTSEFVTLKVFDLLGREAATLVNEDKPAGSYKIDFNGANLSSGIYFYKLQTGNVIETKKMILMK